MIEDSQVFHKTDKGHDEISHPGGALSPKVRRCLILIDGAKDVGTLASVFRPGEVDALLQQLQAGGFIALEGGAPATAAPATAAPAAGAAAATQADLGPAEFIALRARAAREVSHRLGPNGDPLAEKIEGCKTPHELQVALKDAERTLAMFLGPEYAKTFAQRIGLK